MITDLQWVRQTEPNHDHLIVDGLLVGQCRRSHDKKDERKPWVTVAIYGYKDGTPHATRTRWFANEDSARRWLTRRARRELERMRAAAPEVECDMCDGTGLMEGWNRRDGNPCPQCKGTGRMG